MSSSECTEPSAVEVKVDEVTGKDKMINNYVLGNRLGKGSFAAVFHCRDATDDGKEYAMKIFSKNTLKRQRDVTRVGRRMVVTTALDSVRREIALLKKIQHPCIVSLVEVLEDEQSDRIFLVMELVSGGQVMFWRADIAQYRDGGGLALSESRATQLARDVVLGLDYLHSHNISHRDLKPENLLLSADGTRCRIADFGVATMFSEEMPDGSLKRMEGTHQFQAPECLTGESFSGCAADVWALGVTLHAFVLGALPFYAPIVTDLFDAISSQEFVPAPTLSPALRELLLWMLSKDPAKRPTAALLKEAAWLNPGYVAPLVDLQKDGSDCPLAISMEEMRMAFTKANLSISSLALIKVRLEGWRSRAKQRAAKLSRATSSSMLRRATSSSSLSVGSQHDVASRGPVESQEPTESPPGNDSFNKGCCTVT